MCACMYVVHEIPLTTTYILARTPQCVMCFLPSLGKIITGK